MATTYVGIGTNLGDRLTTIRSAIDRLASAGDVIAVSSIYETAPVGYIDQPPYLNAVVGLDTWLAAEELLDALFAIEREHGRERTFPNAPRTLDLDLLLYDDAIINRPGFVVPHPRLHERAFVLVPLAEIAPDVRHPVLANSAAELLRDLGPTEGIELFQS